jgi:hypothetical protein
MKGFANMLEHWFAKEKHMFSFCLLKISNDWKIQLTWTSFHHLREICNKCVTLENATLKTLKPKPLWIFKVQCYNLTPNIFQLSYMSTKIKHYEKKMRFTITLATQFLSCIKHL